MTVWLVAGVVTLCVTALLALMIYANHAGRNAARVRTEQRDNGALRQALETEQAIAQAGIDAPQTREELIQALREGKEGQ